MGTRACIARKTGEGTFSGRYHHWDGYPDGLGATLFKLYRGHFKQNINEMLKFLIDEHPAGWSTIIEADFTKEPGFDEAGFNTSGPHCYCHGGRHEKANTVTQATAADIGCEYAYVFDGNTMLVLSSYTPEGHKMIGMFGQGNPDATWQIIGQVDLNGGEPDFAAMGNDDVGDDDA